ncbi:restriction endonuclease [Sphingobacterium sp. 18053]|uniref:5-methylcytosine restriction system specificity protein McrC n=1 Tax=Sphingobacterium sp. 18053 TaxID=2681401 RepID=UPI001359DD20|nr:restriction endonuclease [Sphingobacterium sp. 18053]
MGILISEHKKTSLTLCEEGGGEFYDDRLKVNKTVFEQLCASNIRIFKKHRGKKIYPYKKLIGEKKVDFEADYYIGVDWVIASQRYIYVEPKINVAIFDYFGKQAELDPVKEEEIDKLDNQAQKVLSTWDKIGPEVNYLAMLMNVMTDEQASKECGDLVLIDWEAPNITINQQDDRLTPFLVVQFLQILSQIVRKGLKKSYYKVQENLSNKVKGKILVSQHIKQNLLKNRHTKTNCEYQVFGVDNPENQFLKKVMQFASKYVENNPTFFQQNDNTIRELIDYCRPTFDQITDLNDENQVRHIKYNPFFKEYKEAVRIGHFILKRFSYNISKATNKLIETPPFWIDMPRLFELYVYSQLIKANPKERNKILYQFSTYGNALDILITHLGFHCIIDAKYKLHYNHGLVHADIRQVAGYARLKQVRAKLELSDNDDSNIDCLIIYPDIDGVENLTLENIKSKRQPISAYHKVWKLNVRIPCIG